LIRINTLQESLCRRADSFSFLFEHEQINPINLSAHSLRFGADAALHAFVQDPPHVRLMAALAPHMNKTKFVRWTVKGFPTAAALG
jgi:hypothetical protein